MPREARAAGLLVRGVWRPGPCGNDLRPWGAPAAHLRFLHLPTTLCLHSSMRVHTLHSRCNDLFAGATSEVSGAAAPGRDRRAL